MDPYLYRSSRYKESLRKYVPAIEQTYSTGAVRLDLLNAAFAQGWRANWMSGWIYHD